MKVLFLSVYMHTPHFETELEIISDLREAGHDVWVARCRGQLATCELNPLHEKHVCVFCRSKFDRGMDAIGVPGSRVLDLAADGIDYSQLPDRFSDAAELRSFMVDGVNLGLGVASSLITRTNRDPYFDTAKHADAIRRELRAAYFIYKAMGRIMDRIAPDEVYIFNGRFSTYFPVILLCEKRGIAYNTHDRAGMVKSYLVRKNCLPHDIPQATREILELWERSPSSKVAEAEKWYSDRRNGVEQSWISFCKDQEHGKVPDSFDSSRRNIAVFSSTLEETAVVPGWENRLFKDELDGLARIFERFHGDESIRFYLRMHPNMKGIPRAENHQLRRVAEMQAAHPNVEVIWPESMVHSYALMERSNLVLSFGSTTGVEAAFNGRPSILAGASFYEKLDCAYVPATAEELYSLLAVDLPPKDRLGALKYAYWEIHKGTPYRKFAPEGLFGGTFMGKRIGPSRLAQAYSLALQLTRVRSARQLGGLVKAKAAKLGILSGKSR